MAADLGAAVGAQQGQPAVRRRYAEDERLRAEAGDVLLRQVDHADDDRVEQVLRAVLAGRLHAGPAFPDGGTEVDEHLVAWRAGAGELLHLDDPPGNHLDLREVRVADLLVLLLRHDLSVPGSAHRCLYRVWPAPAV